MSGHPTPTVRTLVAEIEKNRRQVYRITRDRYRGPVGVQLRIWERDRPGRGALRRTHRGVWINRDDVPDIIAALQKAWSAVR